MSITDVICCESGPADNRSQAVERLSASIKAVAVGHASVDLLHCDVSKSSSGYWYATAILVIKD